jgi:hypothetical protein
VYEALLKEVEDKTAKYLELRNENNVFLKYLPTEPGTS